MFGLTAVGGFFSLKTKIPPVLLVATFLTADGSSLVLNDLEYFEMPGLNVMVFHDYYPEGHQGGVTIIQNGIRVAANGDVRLEPAPGQWQPIPKVGERIADSENQLVTVPCSFPDEERDRKGFNPILYPELELVYRVNVRAQGTSVVISVDLDEPLSGEWIGRVGFNLELFPGGLFGKIYYMDEESGIFPRQLNGPMVLAETGGYEIQPLVTGKKLVIAPECEERRMEITAMEGELQLLDGRAFHNNGWFIVRTPIPAGATQNAVQWLVSPNVLPDWSYKPVVHVSQVGYHPGQKKVAIIECDLRHEKPERAALRRVQPSGEMITALTCTPQHWGEFARYRYFLFDFSEIRESGMYIVFYGDSESEPFEISGDVFDRHVWQPTLEYFLPVQMCHMRVNDRYRVWHGLCHMDDALMAPVDTIHIDGYRQDSSTLTSFRPLQPVPGLAVGGWHDAGDYDLRVESQAQTVQTLSLAYEAFHVSYDETTIDQTKRIAELHRPDGKPDILQQVEHGLLTILAGYKNLGRLYRGIICPTLRQYVLLGDASTMTDNKVFDSANRSGIGATSGSAESDDRWVFTEFNPRRELLVAACLATAARVMREYDNNLSVDCLDVAEELWTNNENVDGQRSGKIEALAELIISTQKEEYKQKLLNMLPEIKRDIGRCGWVLGRVMPIVDDPRFYREVTEAVRSYHLKLQEDLQANPFGVPYRPRIWGAGWSVQQFGLRSYYLHIGWPEIVPADYMLNALNFVLGCHPGQNRSSFASGVGSKSLTVAYGVNRADWSYIPGGVASGTAYIRPDFPELKDWPFLWQQTEYVVGGGASNYMFLVLAARDLLSGE